MKYELAKELKDAGFPQNGVGLGYVIDTDGTPVGPVWRVISKSVTYAPPLSELIEACGEQFVVLMKNHSYDYQDSTFSVKNGYKAGKPMGWDTGDTWVEEGFAYGEGLTPEEAVAHLWLALNKKI